MCACACLAKLCAFTSAALSAGEEETVEGTENEEDEGFEVENIEGNTEEEVVEVKVFDENDVEEDADVCCVRVNKFSRTCFWFLIASATALFASSKFPFICKAKLTNSSFESLNFLRLH